MIDSMEEFALGSGCEAHWQLLCHECGTRTLEAYQHCDEQEHSGVVQFPFGLAQHLLKLEFGPGKQEAWGDTYLVTSRWH